MFTNCVSAGYAVLPWLSPPPHTLAFGPMPPQNRGRHCWGSDLCITTEASPRCAQRTNEPRASFSSQQVRLNARQTQSGRLKGLQKHCCSLTCCARADHSKIRLLVPFKAMPIVSDGAAKFSGACILSTLASQLIDTKRLAEAGFRVRISSACVADVLVASASLAISILDCKDLAVEAQRDLQWNR